MTPSTADCAVAAGGLPQWQDRSVAAKTPMSAQTSLKGMFPDQAPASPDLTATWTFARALSL